MQRAVVGTEYLGMKIPEFLNPRTIVGDDVNFSSSETERGRHFPSLETGEQKPSFGRPSMRDGASNERGWRLISLILRSSLRVERRYSFLLEMPSIEGSAFGDWNSRQEMISLVSKKVASMGQP